MSQENLETVRLAFEAVSRRDKAAFLAMCDPEVETVPLRDFPESAPTRGAEAVWDLFVELQRSWQQGRTQARGADRSRRRQSCDSRLWRDAGRGKRRDCRGERMVGGHVRQPED